MEPCENIIIVVFFSKFSIDGTSTGTIWPRLTKKDKMKYLLIKSAHPTLSENPFADEYNFWNGLPLTSNVKIPQLIQSKTEL